MIDRARVTEALRAMLAAATGKPCGLGQLPVIGRKPASLPYTVLYPQGGPVGGAPLADRSEDSHLVYQLTIVAQRVDQAEWLADRTRRALLARAQGGEWAHLIAVPGAQLWARELLVDDGVQRFGSDSGEPVTAVQRIQLSITDTT